DTRLTRDKNDLALTTHGFLERSLKFTERTCPADHLRYDIGWQIQLLVNHLVSDRCNKLVSTLRERFNVNGIVMLAAQDLANSENVFLDEFRIDVCLRPQRFQKFILCH